MRKYNLTVNDNDYEVIVKETTMDSATVEVNGVEHIVAINEIRNIASQEFMPSADEMRARPSARPSAPAPSAGSQAVSAPTPTAAPAPATGGKSINAPIPGQVKGVFIKVGEAITSGQKVLVMEAMKMENVITATFDGTVSQVLVAEGDSVNQDQQLVILQ